MRAFAADIVYDCERVDQPGGDTVPGDRCIEAARRR
jgi:hypothetical protein